MSAQTNSLQCQDLTLTKGAKTGAVLACKSKTGQTQWTTEIPSNITILKEQVIGVDFGFAAKNDVNVLIDDNIQYEIGGPYGPGNLGSGAVTGGFLTDGSGQNSVSFGNAAKATETNSISIGAASESQAENSISIGASAITTSTASESISIGNLQVEGSQSIVIGYLSEDVTPFTQNSSQSVTIGLDNNNQGNRSITLGIGNTSFPTASDSVSIGKACRVEGIRDVSIGANTSIKDTYERSVAIGSSNEIEINTSPPAEVDRRSVIAIGDTVRLIDCASTLALGRSVQVTLDSETIALGRDINIFGGEQNIVVGSDSGAWYCRRGIVMGRGANINALGVPGLPGVSFETPIFNAIAIGTDANSLGDGATAIGNRASATHAGGTAIGQLISTTAENSFCVNHRSTNFIDTENDAMAFFTGNELKAGRPLITVFEFSNNEIYQRNTGGTIIEDVIDSNNKFDSQMIPALSTNVFIKGYAIGNGMLFLDLVMTVTVDGNVAGTIFGSVKSIFDIKLPSANIQTAQFAATPIVAAEATTTGPGFEDNFFQAISLGFWQGIEGNTYLSFLSYDTTTTAIISSNQTGEGLTVGIQHDFATDTTLFLSARLFTSEFILN